MYHSVKNVTSKVLKLYYYKKKGKKMDTNQQRGENLYAAAQNIRLYWLVR